MKIFVVFFLLFSFEAFSKIRPIDPKIEVDISGKKQFYYVYPRDALGKPKFLANPEAPNFEVPKYKCVVNADIWKDDKSYVILLVCVGENNKVVTTLKGCDRKANSDFKQGLNAAKVFLTLEDGNDEKTQTNIVFNCYDT